MLGGVSLEGHHWPGTESSPWEKGRRTTDKTSWVDIRTRFFVPGHGTRRARGGTRHCLDHCGCPLWLAVRRLEIDLGGKRVGTLVCLQLGSPPQPPSNFKQDEALLWQLWELWEAVRLPSRGIDPVFAARYRAGSCCATDFSEQPTAKTASRLVVSD